MAFQENVEVEEAEIVIPDSLQRQIGEHLRELTKAIFDRAGEGGSYGLGGQYGYGAKIDNEVFEMHPYCWCDSDNCEWCNDGRANFVHKNGRLEVTWYKYIGRGMEISIIPQSKTNNIASEVDAWFLECVNSLPEKLKRDNGEALVSADAPKKPDNK
jgi:hypothetical protein